MLYILPTKRGLGATLWGTWDDLDALYEFIGRFRGEERFYVKDSETREKILASFSYDVRKAQESARLKSTKSPVTGEKIPYLGNSVSWVQFLFALAALRYNMQMTEVTKPDVALILHLEYQLEQAMYSYDPAGAKTLQPYLAGAIYAGNEYLYLFMRSIDADYFRMGGGKTAFRRLSHLLKRASFMTKEYNDHAEHLEKEAKRLNCSIVEMDINDGDVNYDMDW